MIFIWLLTLNWNEMIPNDLLNRNPDNRQYYLGLEEARELTEEVAKLEFYTELCEEYPRSTLARRIPLNYVTGERFRVLVGQYLRRALHKGAPPLFVDLRSLYTNADKVATIEELLLSYVANLTEHERFSQEGITAHLNFIVC